MATNSLLRDVTNSDNNLKANALRMISYVQKNQNSAQIVKLLKVAFQSDSPFVVDAALTSCFRLDDKLIKLL